MRHFHSAGSIKDASTKTFGCETSVSFSVRIQAFLSAYNSAKHLKISMAQVIYDAWKTDPAPFKLNPHDLIPRPNGAVDLCHCHEAG